MNDFNETTALAIFSETPFLGAVKIRLLIEYFGSAQIAIKAQSKDIKELSGFTPKIIEQWGWWEKHSSWRKNLDLAEQHEVELIPYTHADYPKSLLQFPDSPIILYVKGKLKTSDRQSIAVVGTRNASRYGIEIGGKISRDLAHRGFTVVSGLARGIDTAAHHGALETGRTIAVIGSGLANIYPQENKALADQIALNGALISEFPMMTPPDRKNFPQRNRIVSGMTKGALLVEAPEKSGAMTTMNKAWQQKKPLFCLPGPVHENFHGNHSLIKAGKAQLVENAGDIAQNFDQLFSRHKKLVAAERPASPPLEKEEKELLKELFLEELSIEDLAQTTKLPVRKINILLMGLLLKRVIKEYPGKIYKKC